MRDGSLFDDPGIAAVDQLFQVSRTHLFSGRRYLSGKHLFVSRLGDVAKHSDGNRIARVLHARKHVGQV